MRLKDVNTKTDLARLIGIELKKLTFCVYKMPEEKKYSCFEIPKKDGTVREIYAPKNLLKQIQKNLADALNEDYAELSRNNVAHGFIKGKSIITNASFHRNKKVIINIDISDFFGTIHFGRVKGFFQKNKYYKLNDDIAKMIANIVCYDGKLPQGAPTSPVIANMIGLIIDYHILKLCKKYKLYYTRYADDMTFSTNDKHFIENYVFGNPEEFIDQLRQILFKLGFKLNEKKTRICLKDNKQEVTGVVVNNKLNANKSFIKETRAMAYSLYTKGKFYINNEEGTMNQLEGRFSFIDQFDYYNNKYNASSETISKRKNVNKNDFSYLNSRERAYQHFLFYKLFLGNDKPIIFTEGKTDSRYIKAALKNNLEAYPGLVGLGENDDIEFRVLFSSRNKKYKYFLHFVKDGADGFYREIASLYTGAYGHPNLYQILYSKMKRKPLAPVILLLDNEYVSGKPLYKFLNAIHSDNSNNNSKKNVNKFLDDTDFDLFFKRNYARLTENLYLATFPLKSGKKEMEIEDLFDDNLLEKKFGGKSFKRKPAKGELNVMNKDGFSKYVLSHYNEIDFSGFKGLLNIIVDINKDYKDYLERIGNNK